MMNWQAIHDVEHEMLRLQERIRELKAKTPKDRRMDTVWSSKESGAVRRSSMDLTRALAAMRRWS